MLKASGTILGIAAAFFASTFVTLFAWNWYLVPMFPHGIYHLTFWGAFLANIIIHSVIYEYNSNRIENSSVWGNAIGKSFALLMLYIIHAVILA